MFWSQPKPWAKTIGGPPGTPWTCTLLRLAAFTIHPSPKPWRDSTRRGRGLCGEQRLLEQRSHTLQRAGTQAEVGVRAALLTVDDSRVEELLEVVADRRLLELEQRFEITDADRLAARGHEAVEDLDAVTVRQRLEDLLQLRRVLLGQRRLSKRRTALDKGQ